MGYIDTLDKRKRIQRALAEAHDAEGQPYYSGKIDGDFGDKSVDAIVRFRRDHDIIYPPHPAAVDTDLMRELGLLAIQNPVVVGVAKSRGIDLLALIGLIGSIRNFTKGLQMDSANVDVKSAWLSSKNWAAGIAILTNTAAIFHIVIPPDLAPTVQTFVTSAVALYILVKNTWFTGSITAASAKKL